MKRLVVTFIICCLFGWAQAQSTTPVVAVSSKESLKAAWESTSHNFGKIKYQVPQTVSFTFTNYTSEPILITEAKGSCGCTVASFTEEPIAPGATGMVKATYNAATLGAFNKTVSVKTTAQDTWETLKITGIVVE